MKLDCIGTRWKSWELSRTEVFHTKCAQHGHQSTRALSQRRGMGRSVFDDNNTGNVVQIGLSAFSCAALKLYISK